MMTNKFMYKIIGTDGKEYGPVTADQLRHWIAENRANAQTLVQAAGSNEWKPLGTLADFSTAMPPAPAAPPPPPGLKTPGVYRKTSGLATGGLVCGIFSVVCCCGFPLGILGIFLSIAALSQIKRHPDLYEGHVAAITGLVLSIVGLFVTLIAVLGQLITEHAPFHWHPGRFGP